MGAILRGKGKIRIICMLYIRLVDGLVRCNTWKTTRVIPLWVCVSMGESRGRRSAKESKQETRQLLN